MGTYLKKIENLKESKFINSVTYSEFKKQYEDANEFIREEMDRLSFFLDIQ